MTAAAPTQHILPLARPVTALHGVGPERAAQLARLEIRTIADLLLHRPRRYEDRRHLVPIAQLQLGEAVTTRGTVVALGVKWYKQHTKSIFELILDDGTARLHCRWWNLPFMEKYFAVGNEVIVFGKPVELKPRTMGHPETEVVEAGGLSIYMLHDLGRLDLKPEAAGFRIVVYGHSHQPKLEEKNGVLYFNPGSAGPRRFSLPVSVGSLMIEAGTVRAELVELEIG